MTRDNILNPHPSAQTYKHPQTEALSPTHFSLNPHIHILAMNPSTFQNFEDIEKILDNYRLPSLQCLDQQSLPYLQSSTDMQNQITDPIQLQIQGQVAAQARCKIQQLQAQIDVLQSQVDAEQTQMQSQQIEEQPDLQLQTSTDMIPAPQSFCGVSYLPPDFQPLEPGSAHTEDMEVDEIQPNIPPEQPEKPKSQKASRRAKAHSTDQNPPKRRRIEKNSTKNSNDPLRVGSTSNANKSNAMRIGDSKGHVKCPACDDLFTDSHAMRQHFRMIHASTDMKKNICHECIQPCGNGHRLREHWYSAHVGELVFVCDLCGARFSKHRNLSLHRTKLHNLPDRRKPLTKRIRPKLHKCKLCDFASPQEHNVVIHFSGVHTDEVGLECPGGCGRSFESAVDTQVHFFSCKQ